MPVAEPVRERSAGFARRDRLTDPSTGMGGVLFTLVVGVAASDGRARHRTPECRLSARSAGDERGDDVGGVPVQ